MEDKFDNYLNMELDSISNSPFDPKLWDKEKSWNKIAVGIKPQAKLISIKWLYAAASILLFLLFGSSYYYKNYNGKISQLEGENQRLMNILVAKNKLSNQNVNYWCDIDTIFQTKETIKKEIVLNTIYVHDTVKIISFIKEQVNDQIALNNKSLLNDSAVLVSSNISAKKSKLHFVLANEPVNKHEDNKLMLVSSKSLFQNEQETAKPDFSFKISVN